MSHSEEKSSSSVQSSSALVHSEEWTSQSSVQTGDEVTQGKKHPSELLVVSSQSVHSDIPIHLITDVDTLVFSLQTTLEAIVNIVTV